MLGPFYQEGAPELPAGADIANGANGEPAFYSGRLLTLDGRPIAGGLLDVWSGDGEGFYDMQIPGQSEMLCRGKFRTDQEGRYRFRSIRPTYYPVPTDGPVGRMLGKMGRHPYRPGHIHMIVSAPGYESGRDPPVRQGRALPRFGCGVRGQGFADRRVRAPRGGRARRPARSWTCRSTRPSTISAWRRRKANLMEEYDEPEDRQDEPAYRRPEQIDPSELRQPLIALPLLGDDMFLRMQAFNLAIIDRFLMQLEADALWKLMQEERTPVPEAAFLSAQSQMWIFAAYELLRTWRERVCSIRKWAENGGLEAKRQALERDVRYAHPARKMRAEQIRRVQQEPTVIDGINDALRAVHMPFARLEALRISMAKHEITGRSGSVASLDHSWRSSAGRVRGRLGRGSGWRLGRERSGLWLTEVGSDEARCRVG